MPPKVSKIEQELKKLTKIQENKTCCDCPEKMPAYADLTNSVFVCTKCAGIHRDFQFKVKGISMSVFSEEDVAYLASMGNGPFNAKYMAGYNSRDHPLPTGNDVVKLKEFIRAKYLDKRWYREEAGPTAPQPAATPANSNSLQRSGSSHNSSTGGFAGGRSGSITIKPLGSTAKQSSFRQSSVPSGGTPMSNTGADLDLLSLDDPAPAASQVSQPSTQSVDPFSSKPTPAVGTSNGSDSFGNFDPFGSAPHPQHQQQSDPFGSTPQHQQQADPFSSGGFDAFSGAPNNAPANTGGFDAFSNTAPVNQQYQQQQFGGFSNFGGPNSQVPQPPMPMPFIKLAPPPPPEKEPQPFDDQSDAQTSTAPSKRPPDPKNFSAFDELVPEIPQASSSSTQVNGDQRAVGTGAPTPFDGQHGAPASYPPAGHYGGYPQHPPNQGISGAPSGYPAGHPANVYQGYPPVGTGHGYGGGYYGAPQQGAPYGAHQQGAPYGAHQQGAPYGAHQQGAPYGAHQQGAPYGAHQQGAPYGAPQQGAPYGAPQHGQYPNHQPQQPYGSQPHHPQSTSPGLAPQPAPVDPFAAMSGAAWNAVGGAPPAGAPQGNAPAGPTPSAPPTNAAPSSVNPFDMF